MAPAFTGMKVFSTTMLQDVKQSSDAGFHCLSITLFTRERRSSSPPPRVVVPTPRRKP
jgi:hypothetical protein